MKLNLTEIIDAVAAWEFVVEVDGIGYATRSPAVADLAMLRSGENLTGEKCRELVASLFANPRPEMSGWTEHHLGAVLLGYCDYLKRWAEKNSQAVADKTLEATARQMPIPMPIPARTRGNPSGQ